MYFTQIPCDPLCNLPVNSFGQFSCCAKNDFEITPSLCFGSLITEDFKDAICQIFRFHIERYEVFKSVMGISGGQILIALDSLSKYHLTSLATGILPAMLLLSFPNREVLYLQLRDFKGLSLKCIHQLSSRWFKTCTKHMHVFSFTATVFPLAKAFLFLWFCRKFPG